MTIQFYDVDIEEMREATQEDWNLRHQRLVELTNEVHRLRSRLIRLEASAAVTMGTLEPPPASTEPDFTITHDVPGNAPR
jgi:hypothetical protein